MRRIIQRKKPLKREINFEKIGKAISIFTLFSTSIGRVLDIIQQKEERGGYGRQEINARNMVG